jgi:serine/threonine protein kinase
MKYLHEDRYDKYQEKISFERNCLFKQQINDFEYLKILGRGTFGKVVLCRERTTQRIFAMKMLRKSLVVTNV